MTYRNFMGWFKNCNKWHDTCRDKSNLRYISNGKTSTMKRQLVLPGQDLPCSEKTDGPTKALVGTSVQVPACLSCVVRAARCVIDWKTSLVVLCDYYQRMEKRFSVSACGIGCVCALWRVIMVSALSVSTARHLPTHLVVVGSRVLPCGLFQSYIWDTWSRKIKIYGHAHSISDFLIFFTYFFSACAGWFDNEPAEKSSSKDQNNDY